jgi:hypothetical protein
MFDVLRTILSNPFYALLTVLSIWGGLFLLLSKILKLSTRSWTRLEYIWIFIGLFGIMSLVDENRKRFIQSELTYLQNWIESDYKDLLKSLKADYNCTQYNHNVDLFTKNEFDSLQNRQNTFCEWAKNTYQYVDSCYRAEDKLIGKFPILKLENKEEIYPYDQITSWRENINQNLKLKKEADRILADDFWTSFKSSIGLLLVYIAFGLRLAITTNKLRIEKRNTY